MSVNEWLKIIVVHLQWQLSAVYYREPDTANPPLEPTPSSRRE
jgi:hypothetical protein